METVIKTEGLTKKYGSFTAVKSVDLSIDKGEIYGFIGLNGAGKTTTIRMLLGMIKPTAGHVELFGERITPDSTNIWSKVGFIVEVATAYPELTVIENIEASRRLYQLANKKATGEVMEKLNLTRYKNKKAKHLSLGNYQRLAIAKALLHRPELLILDEPTNGLDPAGIVEIRNLLQDLAKDKGVTVFISSHILGEIYRFTTKIGIIHEGALVDEMDIETLNKRMGERLVLDAVNQPVLLAAVKSLGYDQHLNSAGEVEISDSRIIEEPETLVAQLVGMGVLLNKVNVEKEDLEQYFLNKVGVHEELA
ncbi:MAG TPA: ABC transporter ATP-binding protein [Anaerolineae bacterium]|nr:ABC transporter ATP-binding protein [Anaerolineae bacterium]